MTRALVVAAVVFGIAGSASEVRAALADRVGATFESMADDFVKAAAPTEGLVVSLEREVLYLDLGESAGVRVGQELTVFRKGDVFVHPLTGKPLGRYEDVLGHAQIRRVFPQFSEAAFIPLPKKPTPRPEDGIRITRARLKIAIAPVIDLTGAPGDVRRVPFLMASVLERSKRFQVVDPLDVGDLFAAGPARAEELLARPQRAVGLAREFEVSAWLVPVLLERRGVTYLDVTWISAITGRALLSRREPLLPATPGDDRRFPWEPLPHD